MENYLGVEFESPRYRGAGIYFFAAIAPYSLKEAEPPAEDEEPSDLDEIRGTSTFKKAEDMEPYEDGFEPFYTDTIPEEEIFYLWKSIYPLIEQDEKMYPLLESVADSILMDESNWAQAA
jgi:hypothetical protein